MSIAKNIRDRQVSPIKRILVCLLIGLIVIFSILAFIFTLYVNQIDSSLTEINQDMIFNLSQNSKIYASDGETVLADMQIEDREPVNSLDEISPYLIKATLSVEDARFYQHKGIDYLGLFRAFTVIFSGGNTQGGSTITMQLVRNTLLSNDAQKITLERKISEMIYASKIEKMYNKDQILLMYLNTISYGDRCYGIKAASKHYYSMDPNNLDINQSATLAGIPQSPSYLNPTGNLEGCTNRRNIVLTRMYDDHVIAKEEYETTKSQPITLNVSYSDYSTNSKCPYFTSYIREKVLEQYSNSEIFQGGFQIYTTLDMKCQEACELGCRKENDRLEIGAESVAVTLNPENGYITGMVGGADYSTNQFNIATSSGRPTGSSFKLCTLASSIEQGYDPYSYYVDCSDPLKFGDITVHNFGNIDYGNISVQRATAVSSNTGFVRLQQELKTASVIDMARRLGIKNANLPEITTLTLGSANVNPIELASAYATVANGGIYYRPISILKIVTPGGDEIYSYDPYNDSENGRRVIDEKVAAACTKVLQTVYTQGTAAGAAPSNGQPVAGKTGTSEDYRDHTQTCYTPKFVISTWIGKRNYQPTLASVNCNYLIKTIADELTRGQPIVEFPKVEDPIYTHKNQYGNNKYNNNQYNYNYNYSNDNGNNSNSNTSRTN